MELGKSSILSLAGMTKRCDCIVKYRADMNIPSAMYALVTFRTTHAIPVIVTAIIDQAKPRLKSCTGNQALR